MPYDALQHSIQIIDLGLQDYAQCLEQMRQFTDQRNSDSLDQLWLVEHPAVFTQGQAGKAEHVLNAGDIPIIQADRGGQVTYHGPGQLVAYPLIDLRRRKLGVRELVTAIENSLIKALATCSIDAYAKPDAPGVYVNNKKIASLGLRIRKGCSFHGLALNVNMDLEPFSRINPCGYAGLNMTQTCQEGGFENLDLAKQALIESLMTTLDYQHRIQHSEQS
ncbi:lipoyl(octanoyl) transferase LipB [Alginatibacterium sediminis]|uniref:Octanoyltransferase n=1 Tax=Alginatibacterium sediminis TaxID=2164068 RepID=A0A420E5B4_9ALTE|nr:lipoyl(octanoyl) transferase LipB [Alginatibacterium sediminis]RKF12763.1 lipoyl(octanoyl) transferase LipB [Alginatibacterium sediminis]